MRQLNTVAELRTCRDSWRAQGERVALVPTMGNLHEGHLALVKQAKALADRVVVSIFVNPMQFGANEDLSRYPRTLEADKAALNSLAVDAVFTPAAEEIYPRGLSLQTQVSVPEISDVLCGKSRPGHFQGVATVVSKLFNMVQPEVAVFGKKDYQQLLVIKLMAADLSFPIEIVGVETKRNDEGLALSSRNGYLSDGQKQSATVIYRSMVELATSIKHGGDVGEAITQATERWQENGLRPDYLEIRRQSDLSLPTQQDRHLVVLAAAYMENTRLIDNLEFTL